MSMTMSPPLPAVYENLRDEPRTTVAAAAVVAASTSAAPAITRQTKSI